MPEAVQPEKEDAALVKDARSGDTQAFGILYERYAANLYRFFCVQLPGTMEAEDLTSEVFLRAWNALPGYRERGYPFSAFLFKIARNALVDYRRKKSKENWEIQEDFEAIPDTNPKMSDRVIQLQAHQKLWHFLAEIKESYRIVLILRFINGLTIKEISRVINRSEGAVRVLQHRGLQVLRGKLERAGMSYEQEN